MSENVLVISNADIGDETFGSDKGCWNVTRAMRDCVAGKHKIYEVTVSDIYEANAAVEVDEEKVSSMVADPKRLMRAPPIISIMEDGRAWLIEGHHRVRALHRLGIATCGSYIIEEEASKPYRVYFNGKRVEPWRK